MPSSGKSPVDLNVLTDLIGDDPQVMEEVLAAFRKSIQRTSVTMVEALASGGARAVSDVAHKLMSGARSIGAAQLGQVCAQIEFAAAGPDVERLHLLVSNFHVELQAVQRYLDERQGTGLLLMERSSQASAF